MQNLANKVQQYLKQNKIDKRYRVFALVLSLVVAISVFGSLIMPAVSMTDRAAVMSAGTVRSTGSFDLSEYIYTESTKPGEAAQDDIYKGSRIELDSGQEEKMDQKQGTFILNFYLPPAVATQLSPDNKTFTYKLPDGISVNESKSGTIDHGGQNAADYTIDTNGELKIVFRDNYINAHQTDFTQSGFTGSFSFISLISRGEEQNGDVTINLNGSDSGPSITVDFKARSLTMEKTGSVDEATGQVKWEITVRNPQKVDLTGSGVNDTMFPTNKDQITVEPKNAMTVNNGSLEFTDDAKNSDKIIISYTTDLKDSGDYKPDGGYISNKANLIPKDGVPEIPEATSNVNYGASYSISKSDGTPDYKMDGVNKAEGMIYWTVSAQSKYGNTLQNTQIQDDAFKNTDTKINGLTENVDYTIDTATGTLTILKDVQSLDITYSTPAENTVGDYNVNRNKVKITVPNTEFSKEDEKTCYYKAYNVTKNGNIVTEGNGKFVKWTIKVDLNDSSQAKDFSGIVITDEMFSKAEPGSIKIKTDNVSYTLNGNEMTLNGSAEWGVEIEYMTPVTDDMITDNGYRLQNVAGVKTPGGLEYSASVDTTVEEENRLEKSMSNANIKDDSGTISWNVTIKQESGIAGKTYTDTLAVTDESGNLVSNVYHYITKEQAEKLNVSIQKNKTWEQISSPEKYYNIDFYDESGNKITDWTADTRAVKYEISFKNVDDFIDQTDIDILNGNLMVNVGYSSTVDCTDLDAGNKIKFVNKGEFTGCKDKPEPSYLYEKLDKSQAPYTKYDGDVVENNHAVPDQSDSSKGTGELKKDADGNYIFSWIIALNNDVLNGESCRDFSLQDTLPTGFKLTGEVYYLWGIDSNNLSEDKKKGVVFTDITDEVNQGTDPYGCNFQSYAYYTEVNPDTQQQVIHFVWKGEDSYTTQFGSNPRYILYTAKISPNDFSKLLSNGQVTVTNKLNGSLGDNTYPEMTQTQTVNDGVISKDVGTGDKVKNRASYVIDVNPFKQVYNGGKPLSLEDIFYVDLETAVKDANNNEIYDFSVGIDSFKVIDVDTGEEITDCKYTLVEDVDEEPPEIVKFEGVVTDDYPEDIKNNTWGGKVWYFPMTKDYLGKTVNFTIDDPGTPNAKFYGINGWGAKYLGEVSSLSGTFEFNDISSDGLWLIDWGKNINSVTVEAEKPKDGDAALEGLSPVARMIMQVPDGKHLKIEYSYHFSRTYTGDEEKDPKWNQETPDTITALNTVKITSSGSVPTQSKSDTIQLTQNANAIGTTGSNLTIAKVDAGEHSTNLKATFRLSKWDSENNKWLYAGALKADTKIEEWVDDPAQAATFDTSSEAKNLIGFVFDSGLVYRLQEVYAPTGYNKPNDEMAWYFVYSKYPSDIDTIIENINQNITDEDYKIDKNDIVQESIDSTLVIKNNRNVTMAVQKIWDDNSTSDVYVQLYKSKTYSYDSFPSNMEAVGSVITLTKDDGYVHYWGAERPAGAKDSQFTDVTLTNGDLDDAYYYYICETDKDGNPLTDGLTVNGKAYNVSYSSYASNGNETVTITNSSGMTIQKQWLDGNNDPLHESVIPVDEIQIKLWASDDPKGSTRYPVIKSGNSYIIGGSDDTDNVYTLTNDNWSINLSDLPKTDSDGNELYYFVEEITEVEGFVNGVNDGVGNMGVITITNRTDEVAPPSSSLPETGGTGTVPYKIAGAAIACTTAVLLVAKRRKSVRNKILN